LKEGLGGILSAHSKLKQDIGTALFVRAAVGELYGLKTMLVVKAARTNIGLERIEPNRPS